MRFLYLRKVYQRGYLHVRWETTDKKDYILRVQVKQGVSAWGFAFLDELLLICGTLTGDGQEDFSMSAQPGSRKKYKRISSLTQQPVCKQF